jgi:PTH1 family peptidyl-tRNA hydrolase
VTQQLRQLLQQRRRRQLSKFKVFNVSAGFQTVVGLGNPGARYDATRHNIGFAVVDALRATVLAADGAGVEADCRANARAAIAGTLAGSGWIERSGYSESTLKINDWSGSLIKPQTFMNRSGEPLQAFLSFRKIPISNIIVVHDEIDLPFGVVRVKVDGGEGGHNGLRSISERCGGRGYARVRVGVGKPPPGSPLSKAPDGVATWVLGRFSSEEEPFAEELVAKACGAVATLILSGVKKAQNKYNG